MSMSDKLNPKEVKILKNQLELDPYLIVDILNHVKELTFEPHLANDAKPQKKQAEKTAA